MGLNKPNPACLFSKRGLAPIPPDPAFPNIAAIPGTDMGEIGGEDVSVVDVAHSLSPFIISGDTIALLSYKNENLLRNQTINEK